MAEAGAVAAGLDTLAVEHSSLPQVLQQSGGGAVGRERDEDSLVHSKHNMHREADRGCGAERREERGEEARGGEGVGRRVDTEREENNGGRLCGEVDVTCEFCRVNSEPGRGWKRRVR